MSKMSLNVFDVSRPKTFIVSVSCSSNVCRIRFRDVWCEPYPRSELQFYACSRVCVNLLPNVLLVIPGDLGPYQCNTLVSDVRVFYTNMDLISSH